MNATDYFTYVNAMFLFCIFICGLLVWAVIWGLNTKKKLNDDLTTVYRKLNLEVINNTELMRKYDAVFKQHVERGKRIIALEVAKDNAEKESRDLRKQLTESESQANGYKAEFIAVSNELEATKAKVRKRDKDGKFLPSGNGRVRTPKKLKLVTDLGENEVIHCKTAEEKKAICRLMHEAGLRWVLGGSYMEEEHGDYGSEHCYRPKAGIQSPLSRFQKEGRIIHPASDFIARPKRVKKVSLKVSADITAVQDAIQGVKAASNELSNHAKEASAALDNFSELVSTTTLPKLIHGLTVKNPTKAEAKMIFDVARRLGLPTVNTEKGERHSVIWYGNWGGISWGTDLYVEGEEFVTAKEFVQRMQNGRG